ncbi:MAG: FecR domain-containing protein [Candidatus Falkowbacteria bacterium]
MISRHSRTSNYYRRPFYKTRGFKFLIFLIIFASAFVYWSIKKIPLPLANPTAGQAIQPAQNLPTAQLVFLEGTAEIKTFGATNWEPLNLNYEIKQGDTVRTNGATKSVIQLPDKSFVRMDANTEIFLKQLSLSDVTIEQTYGHAFHRVNDNTPIIYKVLHGKTELIALGTAFDVSILGQTVEISAIANETKIKIYNATDNSLLNIDTVDQGEKATINPSLEKEKMIQKKPLTQNDLLNDTWFTWNKDLDKQNNFFLGMLSELLDTPVDQPSTKETIEPDAKITLTAKQENDSIKLEWTTSGINNPAAFITLVGKNPDVTFPTAPSHIVSGSAKADTWKGLEKNTYYVRICLKQGDNCGIYSNEITLTP